MTMADVATPQAASPPTPEGLFASAVIRLQKEYARAGEQPTPRAAATMAALRKADPGDVDGSPSTWAVLYSTFPEGYLSDRDGISDRERAAHAALVLYGVHQASQTTPLHRAGIRLGQALRRLPEAQEDKSPVLRRFTSLIAATSFKATMYHLRGLMTLLRREGIQLDHVSLYRDLVALQDPHRAPAVRRQWGRDYFGSRVHDAEETSPGTPPGAPADSVAESADAPEPIDPQTHA